MIRHGNSISSGMTSRGHDGALVREADYAHAREGHMLFRLSPESEEFAVERFGFSQGFLPILRNFSCSGKDFIANSIPSGHSAGGRSEQGHADSRFEVHLTGEVMDVLHFLHR